MAVGPVWARATVVLDADGNALPRQVRRLAIDAGDKGGDAMGDAFNRSFSARLRDGMRNIFGRFNGFFQGIWGRMFRRGGQSLGNDFASGFKESMKRFDVEVRRGGQSIGDNFTSGFKESIKHFDLEFDRVSTDVVRRTTEMARTARDVDFGRWADDLGRFRQVFQELGNDMGRLAIGPGTLEDIGELRQVFDEAGESARRANNDFNILWRELEAGDGRVNRSRDTWRKFGDTLRGLAGRVGSGIGGFFRNLGGAMDDNEGRVRKHVGLWRRLSHNTRQWTLIIGAVIAGMQDIAVLGSAAGAGLIVLGGALASALIGVGTAITVFSNFGGEIGKLPAKVRPAARAFQALGDVFSDLRDTLQVDALADTTDAWKSMGKTIKGLTPAFKPVTKAINGLVKDLAKNLAPGTEKFEILSELIKNAGPNFDSLMRSAGTLGEGLVRAFVNAQPLIEKFLGWVNDLVTAFNDFTKSDAFDEWLGRAEEVFGSVKGLLDSIGRSMDELVTQEATDRLTDFIDNIAGFIEGPGTDLMQFFGELDIFGLLAQALLDIGEALTPLAGPFQDLAAGVREVIKSGIETIAPMIEGIAEVLAPFVQGIADFIKKNPDGVAGSILAIAGAFVVLKGAKGIAGIGSALQGFIGKMDTIVKKGPTWKNAFKGVGAGIIASITTITSKEQASMDDFGWNISTGILLGFAGGPFGALVGGLTAFVVTAVKDAMDGGSYALDQFAFKPGDWVYDLVEGWGDILYTFRDETLPAWGAGIASVWEGFSSTFTAGSGGWLDTIVVRWGETLDGFEEGIPKFFEDLGTAFADGWAKVAAWYDTEFGQPIEHAWTDTVNFFTVEVPRFFSSMGTWFSTEWNKVASWFDKNFGQPIQRKWQGFVNFWTVDVPRFFSIVGLLFREGWNRFTRWFDETFVQPVKQMWEGFVAFWTVKVPAWFASMRGQFLSGLARLAAPFTGFFSDVKRNWETFWGSLGLAAQRAWDTVRSTVDRIVSKIREIAQNPFGAIGSMFGGGFAAGGVLTGPRRILAGEAGPEAIVPLKRNLSQVDPSVRGLSAIAQGKMVGMQRGGMVGAGRHVTVAPGAVQVFDSGDARRTAYDVLDVLANRIGA